MRLAYGSRVKERGALGRTTLVAAVEGGDGVGSESFGDREDGGVDRAEREVGVLLDQLDHAVDVLGGQGDQADLPQTDRAQEGGFARVPCSRSRR